MAFTTLVDYSRQLRQYPDTTSVLSGNTTILGILELGAPYTEGLPMNDYSQLYFSSSTLDTTPSVKYNSTNKNWLFTMPDAEEWSNRTSS